MSENKNEINERQPSGKYAIPFFIVLGLIAIISFLLPLRPTVSYLEKRELAKFPEFSVKALLSGDYFDDITLWYSDTFPGREEWIQIANYTESFHGYSEISIEGTLPTTDEIPPALQIPDPTSPATQKDNPESNVPSDTSTVDSEGVEETEAADSNAEETNPEDAGWGGVDAGDAAEILQSGTAIQIGDAVFLAQGFSQSNSDKYRDAVNDFAARVADLDVTVVSAPPPTAVGVMIEEEYLPKLNCVSQVQLLSYMHSGISEDVVTIDLASALIQHNDEYIYFRTDHHWTALGAYYAYAELCETLGLTCVDIESLEVWPQGDFTGSIFGEASRPHKLRWDTVDAYIPKGDIRHYIYNKNGYASDWPLLSDKSDHDPSEKYIVFGSDFPMTRTVNDSIPDAPNCLLIKDSYGNAYIPFMTQTFHEVYAVDYRKYYNTPICDLIEKYDIDYVIFMPNLTATQAKGGPEMIRRVALAYY